MSGKKVLNASVVVAAHNGGRVIRKTIRSLLNQKFKGEYEVIVVDDGSEDDTWRFLSDISKKSKKIRVFRQSNAGVCKARNKGISEARFEVVVIMDQDCVAEADWLEKLVEGFDSNKVGVVSSYDYYGGTSTAFRKDLLMKVGGYDEEYGYYREDTDLSFKIMELGYEFKLVEAKYFHDHEEVKPSGFLEFFKHVLKRLYYHQNDVLLYKKHPTKICEEFLHVKLGFLVDPLQDFRVATGLWGKGKGKGFSLSSPRGIVFVENKTPLHALIIILGGICYVFAVKFSRLIGSIRFGKLLI